MTVEQKLKSMIVEHGLFESQADKVMSRIKADDTQSALTEVFGKSWDDHPRVFHLAAWYAARVAVIEWMDDEMPKHFARSLFNVTSL